MSSLKNKINTIYQTNRFMSEEGFTYPEVIISLAITGILSLILIGLFFSFTKTFSKSNEASETAGDFLLAHSYLNDEIGKVRPDWRLGEVPMIRNGNEYSFAWYGGVENDRLLLMNENGDFLIAHMVKGNKKNVHRFKKISIERVETITSQGVPYCLSIGLASDKIKESLVIPLSSIPIGRD